MHIQSFSMINSTYVYWVVEVDKNRIIQKYVEKKLVEHVFSGIIFISISMSSASLFDFVARDINT
jgi:NDP-sugar pyrophosphorylase family protein